MSWVLVLDLASFLFLFCSDVCKKRIGCGLSWVLVLVSFLFLVLFWSDVCKKRIRCGLSWVRQGSQAAAWPLVPPTPLTHPCFQSRVHYFSSCATLSQVCLCATLCYSALPPSMPPIVRAPTCHRQVQVQGPFAGPEGDGRAQQGVFYNVRENC